MSGSSTIDQCLWNRFLAEIRHILTSCSPPNHTSSEVLKRIPQRCAEVEEKVDVAAINYTIKETEEPSASASPHRWSKRYIWTSNCKSVFADQEGHNGIIISSPSSSSWSQYLIHRASCSSPNPNQCSKVRCMLCRP